MKILLNKDYIRIINQMKEQYIPTLYQRKGVLVRAVRIKESNTKNKNKSLVLQKVQLPILKEILMNYIDFYSYTKGKEHIAVPNNEIMNMFLMSGEYENIDVINGISETPFMRTDGTICNVAGFDKPSGFFYNPSCEFKNIPANPTFNDANEAYNRLSDLFCDFPFVTKEDRAIPIANILSILARPMFKNVPCFVYEASQPGSGKTLTIDTISTVCFGRITPKQTWPEGKDNTQELEKILSSIAIDASPLVVFDNVSRHGVIGGAPLDKVLTSNGAVKFRILGKSESVELPWNTLIAVTGNNAVANVKGDTRRRILPCRIEPDTENPEQRKIFKHRDLLSYTKKNRASFVVDGLTIMKYWANSGMPRIEKSIGSFENWSNTIIGAISCCGGPDISKVFDNLKSLVDEEYSEIVTLLETLNETSIMGNTIKEIIKKSDDNTKLYQSLMVFYKEPNARKIGKFFRSIEGRIYNGYKLVKNGYSHRATIWNVIKINEQKEIEY